MLYKKHLIGRIRLSMIACLCFLVCTVCMTGGFAYAGGTGTSSIGSVDNTGTGAIGDGTGSGRVESGTDHTESGTSGSGGGASGRGATIINAMDTAIDGIAMVFQAVGVLLAVYSFGNLMLSMKNDDPEAKAKSATQLGVAVTLVALPAIVKSLHLGSYF